MKVVVRSSSLLFTLLSIIFQVPIRRTLPAEHETGGPEAPEAKDTNSKAVAIPTGPGI